MIKLANLTFKWVIYFQSFVFWSFGGNSEYISLGFILSVGSGVYSLINRLETLINFVCVCMHVAFFYKSVSQ